jgi:hypothetical protein
MDTCKHDWLLDSELITTNDGPPQPRQSVFLQCLKCGDFYRDDEIVKKLERLQQIIKEMHVRGFEQYRIGWNGISAEEYVFNVDIPASVFKEHSIEGVQKELCQLL